MKLLDRRARAGIDANEPPSGFSIDGEDAALIGDLTDEPISVPLSALATARGQIKKDKNRLLSVTGAAGHPGTSLRALSHIAEHYPQ